MKVLNRLLILLALASLAGCVSAPLDYPKEPSYAIEETSSTLEAFEVDEWLGGRTDANGFYPLSKGFDAFGARLGLMHNAEVSIDVQYFLMKPDNAGLVFAGKLLEAADRGVRVRLLLDDVFTTVDDVDLAMLDDHPNIEVRIFNPIARKGVYAFNYIGHFSVSNRRMHNKSFTVDNQVSIVGGRNIAVEYFQLETSGEFIDFDMICAGPIVREVSAEFDTYWNHKMAVPMAGLRDDINENRLEKSRAQLQRDMKAAGDTIYADAIDTELMQKIAADEIPPYIAEARLISDSPDKLLNKIGKDQQYVANELRDALAAAEKQIYVFTPYFIPGKQGIKFLQELQEKGIKVVLLTNSLATNNHTSVHSSYSSYRKDILRAGVELWEARADAAKIVLPDGESQLDKLTLHTKVLL